MANSFVEQATLKLIDQTSGPANTINTSLKRLNATGRSMAGSLNSTALSLNRIATSATAAKTALAGMRAPRALVDPQAAVKFNSVAAAINNYSRALAAASRIPPLQPPRVPRIPAGGAGNGGRTPPIAGGTNQPGFGSRIVAGAAHEVGGMIAQSVRNVLHRTVTSAGEAIMAWDDADLRARQTGLTGDALERRKALAMELSRDRRFQQVSAALILENSLEAANLSGMTGADRDVRKQMEAVAKNATIFAGVLKDAAKGAEEARQLSRVVGLQGATMDRGRAAQIEDEIARAVIATGGDVRVAETREMLKQMKSFGPGLSAAAIGDLIAFRDEGGKASTEEFRTFLSTLTRNNLRDKDVQRQIAAGLRDSEGTSTVAAMAMKNPVDAILGPIKDQLRKVGTDFRDEASILKGAQKIGMGFASAAIIRVLRNEDQLFAERSARRRVDPQAGIDERSLRGQMMALEAQFQNVAAEGTSSFLPTVKKGLEGVTNLLASLGGGGIGPDGERMKARALGMSDIPAIASAAVGLGLASAVQGLADPRTRAASAAQIALMGAGSALTGAAGLLASAAGLQARAAAMGGAGGLLGGLGKMGKLGKLGRVIPGVGNVIALADLIDMVTQPDNSNALGEFQNKLDAFLKTLGGGTTPTDSDNPLTVPVKKRPPRLGLYDAEGNAEDAQDEVRKQTAILEKLKDERERVFREIDSADKETDPEKRRQRLRILGDDGAIILKQTEEAEAALKVANKALRNKRIELRKAREEWQRIATESEDGATAMARARAAERRLTQGEMTDFFGPDGERITGFKKGPRLYKKGDKNIPLPPVRPQDVNDILDAKEALDDLAEAERKLEEERSFKRENPGYDDESKRPPTPKENLPEEQTLPHLFVEKMTPIFDQLGNYITEIPVQILASAEEFGTTAGSGIESTAESYGSTAGAAIGAAIREAASNITVTVNQTGSTSNTGENRFNR